ncbi:MAG: 2-C-methyl-D-erythritol 4-phosphate cytidylyltransferase [Lachnospiraceae bacterium]|nr:2-C-methyl-D-erythritol 4-phosphate cytidylyltransferase [Lachnospiraceae bacterium]
MEKIGAVVLAAGQGKRMGTKVAKQFLELEGRPLITYALEAFEASPVDEVVLVTGEEEILYCREKIVKAFGFSKVVDIVPGGRERCHSVYEGLKAFCRRTSPAYVLIHDGARPLVSREVIQRSIQGAVRYGACVAAMPVKDTIKIGDGDGFVSGTPDRAFLWQVQTPQAFSFRLVYGAYERMMEDPGAQGKITDDAMAVELATGERVKLILGDYQNIKVTTPEDLAVASLFLQGVTVQIP